MMIKSKKSQTVYTKNYTVLDKRFPRIASRMRIPRSCSSIQNQYTCHVNASGEKTIEVRKDSKTLYLVSRYDPTKPAKKFVETMYNDACACFVIVGLGLGYHIDELLKRCSPDTHVVVIVPCWELFSMQLHHADFSHIFSDERLFLIVDESAEYALYSLRIYLWKQGIYRISARVFPSYNQIFINFTNECEQGMEVLQKDIADGKKYFLETGRKVEKIYEPSGKDDTDRLVHFIKNIEKKHDERPLDISELSYLFLSYLLVHESYVDFTCVK